MKYSFPYLAKKIEQLPFPGKYKNQAVEAVIFNREDLESDTWNNVWKNIQDTACLYGPENVTFHFPVNNSDYSDDSFVYHRLLEALQRANDIGLHGVVVHSNRIKDLSIWPNVNLENERALVVDTLAGIRHRVPSKTWLALENMPIMDNYGKEIDPLFVFPLDFRELANTGVKVVWDVCHYTNSLTNVQEVIDNKQDRKYYPNLQEAGYMDFLSIREQIVHWHFSAFTGVCNPDIDSMTKEGVLPSKSTLGEKIYADILVAILNHDTKFDHMVFEIQDECYVNRKEILKMLEWVHQI